LSCTKYKVLIKKNKVMNAPVKPVYVRKNKAVYLRKDLPLGFGNKDIIIAKVHGLPRTGYVTSNGFENGTLKVLFRLYEGEENVKFHVLNADQYLECDPWI
jgi:hypothetical protein